MSRVSRRGFVAAGFERARRTRSRLVCGLACLAPLVFASCGTPQVVEEGATLALVEVMKCFSAISYGGEGMPPRAEIVEVRAADGAEVAADEVLFVVKPA